MLFSVFDVGSENAWWVGALFGVGHGLLAGVMMGMMHKMHPRMRGGMETSIVAGAAPGGPNDGSLLLEPPGLFAKNYGPASPPGVVMAHVIYGTVVGLVYSILT